MQTAQKNYKQITHQILSLHLPLNAETLHMSDSRFCQLWQMLAAHAFSFCKGQVLACNGCKRMNSLQTFLLAPNGILEGENPTKWRKVREIYHRSTNFCCWLVGKTWRHLRFWSHYPHRWAFSRLSSVVALCYPTCWNLAREAHRWPPAVIQTKGSEKY